MLKPGQRLVSREGDLWRWDGFSVAANAPTGAARRLAGKNRLADIEARTRGRAPRGRDQTARRGDGREAEVAAAAEAEAARAHPLARRCSTKRTRRATAHAEAEREISRNAARLSALAEAQGAA